MKPKKKERKPITERATLKEDKDRMRNRKKFILYH
jgi:hypothetical protein